MNPLLRLTIAYTISILCCLPALAAPLPWAQLAPIQREALAPLSNEWNTLPEKQQQHFVNLAKRYPQLDATQKQRWHERLEQWSKLTPEQRKQAREKFQAFSAVPEEDREKVKQMVRQQEAEKLVAPATSSVPTTDPAR